MADAQTDVVYFANGDRLTGEVESLDRGKMTFDAPATGVTLELPIPSIVRMTPIDSTYRRDSSCSIACPARASRAATST